MSGPSSLLTSAEVFVESICAKMCQNRDKTANVVKRQTTRNVPITSHLLPHRKETNIDLWIKKNNFIRQQMTFIEATLET